MAVRVKLGTMMACVCVTGIVASGCGSSDDESSAGKSTAAEAPKSSIDSSKCPAVATSPIKGDTIKLGMTGPLALLPNNPKVMKAYFDSVNASGGVKTADGQKKLSLTAADDKYLPSETQSRIREMVTGGGVNAIAGMVGSAPAISVSTYLNQQCVPQLWPIAYSEKLITKDLPFSSGVTSYAAVAQAVGKRIVEEVPKASAALLYQNDDSGEEVQSGLTKGLAGSGVKLGKTQSYETTDANLQSQMTTLAATQSDVLVMNVISVKCSQALDALAATSWRPKVYLPLACTNVDISRAKPGSVDAIAKGGGLVLASYLKPVESADPGVQEFRSAMKSAGIPADAVALNAYVAAVLTVKSIEAAPELTQVGIAEGSRKVGELPDVFAKGITFNQGLGVAPISAYEMTKWDSAKETFASGPVVSVGQ